ncbi:hypothetical protein DMI65_21140 [Escherichia coli]|nr:hypothetical protein [Escherichia coli]
MRDHSMRHYGPPFSDDQIDLNYRSPEVLLAMVDVLQLPGKGAEYVRLDAVGLCGKSREQVASIWKTHLIIKPAWSIIDNVAPAQ